jgi:pimeloyl-ACP methyl ester carboxylesterase
LSLYLNKLLAPNLKPPEQPLQAPVPEQTDAPPVQPAPAENTWQRAKSSVARTFRPATPRRQRNGDRSFHIRVPTASARPLSRPKVKTRTSTEGIDRQKIMMALIPVLAATMAFLLKNPWKVSPVAPAPSTQPAAAAPVASSDIEIAWEIPPLYQPGRRDPMWLPAPPVASAVEELLPAPAQTRVELVVTGILYSEDRPTAIVDTQLVHEGQQISGATVKKIERDSIEFEMNGRTWKQAVDK